MKIRKSAHVARFRHFMTVVLSAVWLAGCSTAGRTPSVPTASVSETEAPEYRIGPGDSLQIFVWNNKDLNVTVPVRPDGRITTPLVEDLKASGKTPTELARELEQRLAKYVKHPIVTVTVTGFVGRYDQQIRIVGQAVQPQAIPYRENITILDAVILAGGLSEFAAGNRTKVIRKVDGKDVEIRVRLDDLLNEGDVSQNIKLMPGDIVVIPESVF